MPDCSQLTVSLTNCSSSPCHLSFALPEAERSPPLTSFVSTHVWGASLNKERTGSAYKFVHLFWAARCGTLDNGQK
ncbi:hypothetical protein JTE90_029308 [Oedothorax gibbosus]|uniref:Uncharacterized protein n=1 Tax=Oedothorax gibbosus TaxID=931172 RepID=A0AAV6TY43_9ARAC|nr:hypothetical protein JTE90_029308 [Oedothorax gibbosus]